MDSYGLFLDGRRPKDKKFEILACKARTEITHIFKENAILKLVKRNSRGLPRTSN